MATKKTHKIGDTVTSFLYKSSIKKIKVVGKIKKISEQFGKPTYILTGGIVEDFPTRTIK